MLRSHVANVVRTARRDLLVGDVARLHAQRMGALVWNGRIPAAHTNRREEKNT